MYRIAINHLFIIYLILFIDKAEIVRSSNDVFSAKNQTNCNLNLEMNEQIELSNKPSSSFINYKKHQKYCDIFLRSSINNLIELRWSYDSLDYFQFKINSFYNRTILIIDKRAHHSSFMQTAGSLISDNNLVLIRVNKALKKYLDNLLIKINNLKLIRLDYKELTTSSKKNCYNIHDSLIDLSFNTNNYGPVFNGLNLFKNLNAPVSSSNNEDCVKIYLRTFDDSKLIIKKRLNTCVSSEFPSSIRLIRSTNIKINAKNAKSDFSICLNVTFHSEKFARFNQTKAKRKTKRNLIDIFQSDYEDDDQTDNCIYQNLTESDRNQTSKVEKLKCYVLFKTKLDFKSADRFCKKILMPYDYSEVGLANLKNSESRDFIKNLLHR